MNETSFIKVDMFRVAGWCSTRLNEIAALRQNRWHRAVTDLNERRKRSFFRRPPFSYEEGVKYLKARGRDWCDYSFWTEEQRIRVLSQMSAVAADGYVYLSCSDYNLLNKTYAETN